MTPIWLRCFVKFAEKIHFAIPSDRLILSHRAISAINDGADRGRGTIGFAVVKVSLRSRPFVSLDLREVRKHRFSATYDKGTHLKVKIGAKKIKSIYNN